MIIGRIQDPDYCWTRAPNSTAIKSDLTIDPKKEPTMSLTKKLAARREASRKQIPPDKLSVMDRATKDLEQSGITASCLKEADTAPDFVLPNAAGHGFP